MTLVEQSEGLAGLQPSADAEPAEVRWRSTLPFLGDAVQLYESGLSLTAISKNLGISWDAVARLLERAGVRERRRQS